MGSPQYLAQVTADIAKLDRGILETTSLITRCENTDMSQLDERERAEHINALNLARRTKIVLVEARTMLSRLAAEAERKMSGGSAK